MLTSLRAHFASLLARAKTCLIRPTKPGKRRTGQRSGDDHSGPPPPPLPSFATMEVSNQLKQVFKVIDANGDGKISAHELGHVLYCLGSCGDKSRAEVEAQVMVNEMDCNGDGFVDLDEFIEAVTSEDGDRKEEEEEGCCNNIDDDDDKVLREAFLIFDADRNGLISDEELQKVLVGLGWDRCGLDECRRMISAVDRDGDGFVDFKEFRSMMIGCSKLAS